MTENLKRAESLFNRIMNQNNNSSNNTSNSTLTSSASTSSSSTNTYPINNKYSYTANGTSTNSNSGNKKRNSKDHHHHHHHHNYHNPHHHHHYNQVVNVDLPRRDPVQVAKETLAHVPQESHVLPYCWTIWHHSRSKMKVEELEEELASTTTEGSNDITGGQTATSAPTVDSYLQTTKEIAFVNIHSGAEAEAAPLDTTSSLGTVEQFWMSLSTLKPAYQLRYGTELLIFKSGINPVWEDPVNAKGGRWVFRFSRRGQNSSGGNNSNSRGDDNESIMRVRKRSSLIWERLVLRVLTGSIIPEGDYLEEIQELLLNDISGLVLSVRRDEDIISIWNSNLNFNKKGSTMSKDGENGTSKKLTLFQARRIICDSILRVIRECDLISQGSDCIETIDSGSNERVFGVSFEYRLHADNNTLPGVNGGDNGANGNNGTSGNGKYGGERSGRKYNNKLYHHKKEGHSNNNTNNFSQGTSTTATTATATTTVSIAE